jgi:hypothetical protein
MRKEKRMREILCESCAADKQAGERKIVETGDDDDLIGPAEYERVVWSRAKALHNCDGCIAQIQPGDRCAAWSVWIEGRRLPGWEQDYLLAL